MSEKIQTNWVMDYETLKNMFGAVFEHYITDDLHCFVIHTLRNDFDKLVLFLQQNVVGKERHISFNGIAFDSQISQYILNNHEKLSKRTGDEIARDLYAYAQYTIDKAKKREFSDYPEWKQDLKHIDLFKMNNWDSGAKSCSLKWAQYATDWHNVEEMPIHHSTEITAVKEINMVMQYCVNDVRSTKHILNLSRREIELRATFSKEYKINLMSASEPKISKELFAYFLCPKMGIKKAELKTMRTQRSNVVVKDVILPYVKFLTPTFQAVGDWFQQLDIDYTGKYTKDQRKELYKFSMDYRGCKTDFGLGGIHGINRGIHEPKPGWCIMSADVTSYYPNLGIKNKWAPAHLPADVFCPLYEWIFDERAKIPKKNPINYLYKIVLNAAYGLSSEENCFLYDPQYTMQITVNGQLLLLMLYERLCESIPGSIPLMQNTDGLEIMIPEAYKETYFKICRAWEKLTSLNLEYDEYAKMIAPDVNNYIAIYKNGKTKCKGRFEWEAKSKYDLIAIHKNKSFLVIQKALDDFFVKGIAPEDSLAANRNIFDYCAGSRIKGNSRFESHQVINQEYTVKLLDKTIRYYISKDHPDGTKLMKMSNDSDTKAQLESGSWKQVVCNQIDITKPFDDYLIDMSYYLRQIYREIKGLTSEVVSEPLQLQIF